MSESRRKKTLKKGECDKTAPHSNVHSVEDARQRVMRKIARKTAEDSVTLRHKARIILDGYGRVTRAAELSAPVTDLLCRIGPTLDREADKLFTEFASQLCRRDEFIDIVGQIEHKLEAIVDAESKRVLDAVRRSMVKPKKSKSSNARKTNTSKSKKVEPKKKKKMKQVASESVWTVGIPIGGGPGYRRRFNRANN
jgi:hypothetical protein